MREMMICGSKIRDRKHPVPYFSAQLQRYCGKRRQIMIS